MTQIVLKASQTTPLARTQCAGLVCPKMSPPGMGRSEAGRLSHEGSKLFESVYIEFWRCHVKVLFESCLIDCRLSLSSDAPTLERSSADSSLSRFGVGSRGKGRLSVAVVVVVVVGVSLCVTPGDNVNIEPSEDMIRNVVASKSLVDKSLGNDSVAPGGEQMSVSTLPEFGVLGEVVGGERVS